ncbi:MAG: glycosyltransferase family 39 protein [Actinomycetota bacterium]|nr:glycosyltransferase family 39 protein [Actinomycetota bacterium]
MFVYSYLSVAENQRIISAHNAADRCILWRAIIEFLSRRPTLIKAAKRGNFAPAVELVLPLLVFILAAFVYGMYGSDGILLRDYSIYLYSGQRVAEGIPPYVGIFDHKGPLSPMITGLGVVLSGLLNWDDIYTVRLVFFTAGCLTVVAIYLLGRSMFRSQAAGFFAALTFLGFYGYAQPATSGPEPKTPMVLFEALCLFFASQKRWFWSGLFGTLAGLVWQPMATFALVALLLAVTRPKEERFSAILRTVAGIAIPLATIVAYFYYHGALSNLLGGFVLFNVLYLVRGGYGGLGQLAGASGNVVAPYGTMLVPIIIGLFIIVRLYFRRPYEYRLAPLLLSLPAPILWSLKDFQLADDFYVFLPYAAVGFGAFVAYALRRASAPRLIATFLAAILLAVALANTLEMFNANAAYKLVGTTTRLSDQREGISAIEDRFGEDVRAASVGSPQVMVLLHQKNPNPYLWISAGVDRYIDAREPGGFEGWVENLKQYDPDVISFFANGQTLFSQHLTSEHRQQLAAWLNSNYHREKIGPWWLYVKNSLGNTREHTQVTDEDQKILARP